MPVSLVKHCEAVVEGFDIQPPPFRKKSSKMENQENPEFIELYRWFILDENSKILQISEEVHMRKHSCNGMGRKRTKILKDGGKHSFITDGQIQNILHDIKVELIKTPSSIDLMSRIYCYLIHLGYKEIKNALNLTEESKENEYIEKYAFKCHNVIEIDAVIMFITLHGMLSNFYVFCNKAMVREFLQEQDPVEILKNKASKRYLEYGMFEQASE